MKKYASFTQVLHRGLSPLLILLLILPPPVYAQSTAALLNLPVPGELVRLSTAFHPPVIKGMRVHPQEPFRFEFIIDFGDQKLNKDEKEKSSTQLIKYFLASLTTRAEDQWVNLSPYEKERVVPDEFGRTDMGRDLLAQDYLLKQITASLLYPEDEFGQIFWKKVYERALAQYGTTNIPINTFNKVWIVPDSADVYTHENTAYIVKSHLKVMLDADYLAADANRQKDQKGPDSTAAKDAEPLNELSNTVMREIVLPALEKEINEGSHFGQLRQIYDALILATWYKRALKSSLLGQKYVNQNKTNGVQVEDERVNQKIYERYIEAYRKGVYNLIREESDPVSKSAIPRKYFGGGTNAGVETERVFRQVSSVSAAALLSHGEVEIVDTLTQDIVGPASGQMDAAPASSMDKLMLSSTDEIKNSPTTKEYDDGKGFHGVSIWHFIRAQERMEKGSLKGDELKAVLKKLNIITDESEYNPRKRKNYYQQILQHLSLSGYDGESIDAINAGTYKPSDLLEKTVFKQGSNARKQGIIEAASNSIDALGGRLGQFGKGVKQIIRWLEATGEDRIDVHTLQKGGTPYQLTILRVPTGQWYIQIKAVSRNDFRAAAENNAYENGTVIRVKLKGKIPYEHKSLNSLTSIKEEIHDRFAYVKDIAIKTRLRGIEEVVNGAEHRRILMPAGQRAATIEDKQSTGKEINLIFDDREIKVIDNGKGMGASPVSRMMVPAGGEKRPAYVTEQNLEDELKELMVIHDTKKQKSEIAIARREEVITTIPVGEKINPDAIVPGKLVLEFGIMVEINQARSGIIFPSEHDPRQRWPIKLAVERMVEGLLANPELDADPVGLLKYINMMIIGLQALAGNNEDNQYIVRKITDAVKNRIAAVVADLQSQGYVFLPHDRQFAQVETGHPTIYLDKHLFDWNDQISLKALGAEVVDTAVFRLIRNIDGKDREIPLVAVDFKEDTINEFENFDINTFDFLKKHPLPRIKGDGYVAIPKKFVARFNALVERRKRQKLTMGEQIELYQQAQLIKLLTDETVVTSYEVETPQKTVELLERLTYRFARSTGGIDSEAINQFLTKDPPELIPSNQRVPEGARKRYMIDDKGQLIDINSGQVVKNREGYRFKSIIPLRNNFYLLEVLFIKEKKILFKILDSNYVRELGVRGQEVLISPDGRYAYVPETVISTQNLITMLDTETEKQVDDFAEVLKYEPDRRAHDVRMSKNGLFVMWLEETNGIRKFYSWDLQFHQNVVFEAVSYEYGEIEHMAKLKAADGKFYWMDLENGNVVTGRNVYTDPQQRFSVFKTDSGQLQIYIHAAHKLISTAATPELTWEHPFQNPYIIANANHITAVNFGSFNDADDQDKFCVIETLEGRRFFVDQDGEIMLDTTGQSMSSIFANRIELTELLLGRVYRGENKLFNFLYVLSSIHPKFPLLIEQQVEAQEATEMKTGEKVRFKGDIVYYREGVAFYTVANGKLLSYRDFLDDQVLDTPVEYDLVAMSSDGQYAVIREGQQLKVLDLPDGTTSAEFADANDYPVVSFDGKYFVLENPKTRNVIYVNPYLRFVDDGFITKIDQEAKPFTKEKPEGEPEVDRQKLEARISLFNAEGYQIVEVKGKYIKYRRTEAMGSVWGVLDGIRNLPNNLPMFHTVHPGDYDDGKGNQLKYLGTQEIYFSHSGRFSIHEGRDSQGRKAAFIFDHVMGSHQARGYMYYDELYVDHHADVVILKDQSTSEFFVMDLVSGNKIFKGTAENVLIDHTGNFAIVNLGKANCRIVHLGTGEIISVAEFDKDFLGNGSISIAEDGQRVYLFIAEYDSRNEYFYEFIKDPLTGKIGPEPRQAPIKLDGRNKFNKLAVINGGKDNLPRYWIEYENKNLTLVRREIALFPAEDEDDHYTLHYKDTDNIYSDTKFIITDQDDLITLGREGTVRQKKFIEEFGNNPQVVFESPSNWSNDLGSLKGNKVGFEYKGNRQIENIFSNAMTEARMDIKNGFVNEDNTFILFQDRDERYYLLDQDDHLYDITDEVESGFEVYQAYGHNFQFRRGENEFRYFYPDRYLEKVRKVRVSAQQLARQKRIRTFWEEQVLSKHDQWISEAQTAYEPFLSLFPREYRESPENKFSERFKDFYRRQERGIHQRFKSAVDSQASVVDTRGLPSEEFSRRMKRIVEVLNHADATNQTLIDRLIQQVKGIDNSLTRQDCYQRLFEGLFELAMNPNLQIDLTSIDEHAVEVMMLGWLPQTLREWQQMSMIYQLLAELRRLRGDRLEINTIVKMVEFLQEAGRAEDQAIEIVMGQLKLFLDPQISGEYLLKWYQSFSEVDSGKIARALKDERRLEDLGNAADYVVLLTNQAPPVRVKKRLDPLGEDVLKDDYGLPVEKITNWNLDLKQRPETEADMHTIDELVEQRDLIAAYPDDEWLKAEIDNYTQKQREAGGYAAELPQNSKDGGAKNMVVEFYKDEEANELIEEISDDGNGPVPGKMLALIIPKSTKEAFAQLGKISGYFGTGKYTTFAGVDRIEIIAKDRDGQAFMFVMVLDREAHQVRLTRVRRCDASQLKANFMVRRVKSLKKTIPQLDQMLAKRSWKMFAGMSQDESFQIFFKDDIHDANKLSPLTVKGKKILTETDFIAPHPRTKKMIKYEGKMRIYSTEDPGVPIQIVDKNGLRVHDLKMESYLLALIPELLLADDKSDEGEENKSRTGHFHRLRLVIQIPLTVDQNRDAFEEEDNDFKEVLQKYIALEFYKALAVERLNNVNYPVESFPEDWEASQNENYWNVVNYADHIDLTSEEGRTTTLTDLISRINRAHEKVDDKEEIPEHPVQHWELDSLKQMIDGVDAVDAGEKELKQRVLLSFFTQLEVFTKEGKEEKTSLYIRRLQTQEKINAERARREAEKRGVDYQGASEDPHAAQHQHMARILQAIKNLDLTQIEKKPETDNEKRLMVLVASMAQKVGFTDFRLAQENPYFSGLFVGTNTVYISANLADAIDSQSGISRGHLHQPTETMVHELGHFFEWMYSLSLSGTRMEQNQVFVVLKGMQTTHDTKGGKFSEGNQLLATVMLAKHEPIAKSFDNFFLSSDDKSRVELPTNPNITISPQAFGFWENLQSSNKAVQTGNPDTPKEVNPGSSSSTGGIDFNPQNVNLNVRGQGLDLQVSPQDLESIEIHGLTPIILSIRPVANLPQFLGLSR